MGGGGGASLSREAMPIGKDTRARIFRPFLHHSTKLAINIPLFTTVYKATIDGRATHCGKDGPGIESRWRRDFPHQALGPTQRPIQWVPGLFRG